MDGGAWPDRFGCGLTGEERAVHVAYPVADEAVGGEPVTRRDGDRHAGLEVTRGDVAARAVIRDQGRALGGQRDELRDGGAGAGAHQVIEVAAGQQEEQQRNGGVEIGMFGSVDGFKQAHEGGEQHAQRNRHIHSQPPDAQ